MRVAPEEYASLELRAHSLLADVPLHDVWRVDLPGGGPRCTLPALREHLARAAPTRTPAAVRFLFGLRRALGALLGWDREPAANRTSGFADRLAPEELAASLVPPGTRDGPFRVLVVTPREAISEARNATVHAFSVFALVPCDGGHRLYWAIYVRPVGRITAWYMRLIDPFRRHLVYPALLRAVRRSWAELSREGGIR